MRRAGAVVLVLSWLCGGAGCGRESTCTRVKRELLDELRADNPTLDKPTVVYSQPMRDKIQVLQERGCALPDLGEAPVLCFLGGPFCPPRYACVSNGGDVCHREPGTVSR